MMDITQLSQINGASSRTRRHERGIENASLNETGVTQNTHFGVSSPRCVWDGNGFRPSSEDEFAFRRWRLRFFVFYGAIVLLLGGLAAFADRATRTLTAAATPTNAATISADTARHPH
jgi:hypothetical protein